MSMSIYEMGSGSGSGAGQNGTDNNSGQQPMERAFRHTPQQTAALKAFFEKCRHPEPEQIMMLGEEIGLEGKQVKYWFQNQRNQEKARQNRDDNAAFREQINNLNNELSKLQEQIQRFTAITSRVVVPPARTMDPAALLPGVQLSDELKPMAMHFAVQYHNELLMMCEAKEPLWIRTNEGREILNVAEYYNGMFPLENPANEHLMRTEASRGSTFVLMNSAELVDIFCNAEKWMEMFPSIVSKAKTLQVVENSENFNGSLYVMYAELHTFSPAVLPRELHFCRYCQRNEDGSWGIVDFPLENLLHFAYASAFEKCRRKPSGCIIHDLPRLACSKVTWLEHVEVQDRPMHPVFYQFLNSGVAFGAAKWLSALERQGERLNSLTNPSNYDSGVPSLEQRENLMNVAKRMMRSFCFTLGTLSGQSWMTPPTTPEDQSISVSTRTSSADEPGQPTGVIFTVASTTTVQHSHVEVFNLLRDLRFTAQLLEVCSSGSSFQELAHIKTGHSHLGNCISVFQISDGPNKCYVLQESYTDKCESRVAFTLLDVYGLHLLDKVEHWSIPIVPVGFVMVPQDSSSCLLTICLQSVASGSPSDSVHMLSTIPVQKQMDTIIHQIKMRLGSANMGMVDHQ